VKLEKDNVFNLLPDNHVRFTKDKKGIVETKIIKVAPYIAPPYVPSKWQIEQEAKRKKDAADRAASNRTAANFGQGSGAKVVGLPVPYSTPALSHLQKKDKGVDDKLFHSVYTECHSCGGTLDFATAMMIDATHAACDDCCSTAELFGMRMEGMLT
jgi:hypothetical protein